MKLIITTLKCIILSFGVLAQNEGNVWYFGEHAGLDFNGDTVVVLDDGEIHTNEGCSSIADSSGNLLFYTDGITVWNREHEVMPNGTGLTGHPSSTQSALILRKPSEQQIFYVFTIDENFSYSVVDMQLAQGMGDVTMEKNVQILSDLNSEKQCATLNSDGSEFWLTVHSGGSFYSFRFGAFGLDLIPVQSVVGPVLALGPGQMKFSPNSNQIALGTAYFGAPQNPTLWVFDFDNSSGTVSNPVGVFDGSNGCYGVEYSADGTQLYASMHYSPSISKLYQYGTSSFVDSTFLESRILLDSSMTYDISGLQIGPDLRIYVCNYQDSTLGLIENPDLAGASCNYQDSAFQFVSGRCMHGLPHLVTNYHTPNSVGLETVSFKPKLFCFPNPTSSLIRVSGIEFSRLELYDSRGNMVATTSTQELDVRELRQGIYILQILNEKGGVVATEKISVLK